MEPKISIFFLFLWIGICLYFSNEFYHWTSPTIKPGQTWIQTFGSEDPFKSKIYDTLKILDVQGDYVQYSRTRKGHTTIESDRKYWIYNLSVLQK